MVYFTIQKRERKIEVKINHEVDSASLQPALYLPVHWDYSATLTSGDMRDAVPSFYSDQTYKMEHLINVLVWKEIF